MTDIFIAVDKEYIQRLFEEKKFIYFPEQKDKKIKVVEIKKVSPSWAKETCVVRYAVRFEDGSSKALRGTASARAPKENAWKIMNWLVSQHFYKIAKPLDFVKEANLLIYEEIEGEPFSLFIGRKNPEEIEAVLKSAAAWLSELHDIGAKKAKLPRALILKSRDYKKIFEKLSKLLPDLNSELPAFDFSFVDKLAKEEKVIIHNDFYPGNVIVGKGELFAIDFEKSGLGARLLDISTLFGWFDFPEQMQQVNFGRNEIKRYQRIFLEEYCRLKNLDPVENIEKIGKYCAKNFFDQAYDFSLICVKGWNFLDNSSRSDYKEKIEALFNKARHYL